MDRIILFSVCVVIGAAVGAYCARLATELTKTAGNTLSAIAGAQGLRTATAIKLEILDKIKLTSNYPIVGLYCVSLLFAAALPVSFWFVSVPRAGDLDPIHVTAWLDPDPGKAVHVEPNSAIDKTKMPLDFLIFRSGTEQTFAISTDSRPLITLAAHYDDKSKEVVFEDPSRLDDKNPDAGIITTASIGSGHSAEIHIHTHAGAATPATQPAPPNEPTASQPVSTLERP